MFNLLDEVEVVEPGNTYSTYTDMVIAYARGYARFFKDHAAPKLGEKCIVVGMGGHLTSPERELLIVFNKDKQAVYVIGDKGIEKINKQLEFEF